MGEKGKGESAAKLRDRDAVDGILNNESVDRVL
jgi:hypothetical protein